MKIMISGGTGLIGKALYKAWLEQEHEVIILSRSGTKLRAKETHPHIHVVSWSELENHPPSCSDVDVVVNLAGETISQRWTATAKNRIVASRIVPARRLAEWAEQQPRKLPLLINASGSSGYGSSETAVFDEKSPLAGQDFLSDVIRQWEAAADAIPAERRVKLRIAPVLSNDGGVFPLMRLPYKLGFGGKIGSGRQPFSWIHIDDMVRLIDYAVQEPSLSGPVNASAPDAVTNDEFGRKLGAVYRRPHWFPAPAWAIKLALGEMSMLILEGQRVYPAAALNAGFTFRYGQLDEALQALRDE
ncbi:TIGR01777 family oxidoreductase [Paenibacillus dendritiformis]|uniref:TIGR01777 family oxidoreductase n=1 Tax=Paenibacillus dendritiformis TaxID=130049 RepID=UPI00387E197E